MSNAVSKISFGDAVICEEFPVEVLSSEGVFDLLKSSGDIVFSNLNSEFLGLLLNEDLLDDGVELCFPVSGQKTVEQIVFSNLILTDNCHDFRLGLLPPQVAEDDVACYRDD